MFFVLLLIIIKRSIAKWTITIIIIIYNKKIKRNFGNLNNILIFDVFCMRLVFVGLLMIFLNICYTFRIFYCIF